MKTSNFIISLMAFVLAAFTVTVFSQTPTAVPLPAGQASSVSPSANAPYQIVDRGPNSRVWQKVEYQTTPDGRQVPQVHKFTELGAGLCRKDSQGNFVDASENIVILPDGTGAATNLVSPVYLPADIGADVIRITGQGGVQLQNGPILLDFDDSTNVLVLGVATHSVGQLISSNQVLYPDIFHGSGFRADLLCTVHKSGLESCLVFREQIPDPTSLGLGANAKLQLLTEFFNPPEPVQTAATASKADGLTDTSLRFGSTLIGHGKAFIVNSTNAGLLTLNPPLSTPVYKTWLHLQNRAFLMEEVPYQRLRTQLQTLPAPTASGSAVSHLPSAIFASTKRPLPPAREIAPGTNQIQMASAGLNQRPGVVLDYVTIDYGTVEENYTFESGNTYFINGIFYIEGGTLTIQDGAVVKFQHDPEVGVVIEDSSQPVVCQTTAVSSAIFTAMEDDSVGDPIPNGLGPPDSEVYPGYLYGYSFYGWALSFANCSPSEQPILEHLRIRYADGGIVGLNGGLIRDCQFLHVGEPLLGVASCTIQNALISGATYAVGGTSVKAANLTVHNAYCLLLGSMNASNSLFVGVANWGDPFTSDHNATNSSDEGVFQSGPLGDDYLASGSPFIDAGNTNADRMGLYWFTTQANQTIEGISPVDLGYHYLALDANGNPVSTLVSGVPDYISDANGNGLPDSWETNYFAAVPVSGSDLDIQGNTLFSDYQAGRDPNVISFTVRLGNQYVNVTNATGNFLVVGGVPSYEAVLVNDNNLNDAVWTNYDGLIYMNLGPTDGVYQVWFGLKGLATNATTSWMGTTVYLDRVAPQIIITNPANNLTTAAPYVQVQGCSPETLATVTYDLSNAVVVITNQPGFKTGHYVDTNLLAFTTNYFQCYDLLLTNGMNLIAIHITDLAGNIATTNLSLTLNYSIAVNPSARLTWPTNGMHICGDSITLRGWTEDSASQVSATISDTNGDTNIISGVVERTGLVWVENLPLNSGTNWVTLCVTNAAGLSSATNFCVVKSSMTLTLTSIDGDLWLPPVNASGQISDPDAPVWVNGVQGTNRGDGTWSAFNVPVTPGGVASFDISATPQGGPNPEASADEDKPAEIVMESDTWNYTEMMDADSLHWKGFLGWSAQNGGFAHEEFHPGTDWNMHDYLIDTEGYVYLDHYRTSGGTDEYFTDRWQADMPQACGSLSGEQYLLLPNGNNILFSSGARSDTPCMVLHTGGKAGSKRKNVFQLTATATEELNQAPWSQSVPPQDISVAGHQLGADGYAYAAYEDNWTVDVTPQVNAPYYTFTVGAGKHKFIHQTVCTALGDLNLERLNIGIGEQVLLYLDPGLDMTPPESPQWTVSGEGDISPTEGSSTTLSAHMSPGSTTVTLHVRDVSLSTDFSVIPPSGIQVVDHYDNAQGWVSGTAEIGADTKYLLDVLPTTVSFKNVSFRENKPAHSIVWPDHSTNSWSTNFWYYGPSPCSYVYTDEMIDGLYSKYKIYNGTSFVDFSFAYSWHDEYKNQDGVWTEYVTKTSFTQFRGSTLTGQETYQGVSGSPIGPFQ